MHRILLPLALTTENNDPGAPQVPCAVAPYCGVGTITAKVPDDARYAVLHTDQRRVGETRDTFIQDGVPSAGTVILVGKVLVPVGGGNLQRSRTIRMSTGKVEVFPFD